MAIFAEFSHPPRTFNAPIEGFALDFFNTSRDQKTRMMPLQDRRKSVMIRPLV